MALNKEAIINEINRKLGADKATVFSQLFDKANNIIGNSSSALEVINKAGITLNDVQKAKALVSSPFSGWAISLFGGNKEEVQNGLNAVENLLKGSPLANLGSSTEQSPVNDLQSLQQTLKGLR